MNFISTNLITNYRFSSFFSSSSSLSLFGFASTRLGSAAGAAELLLATFRSRPIIGDKFNIIFKNETLFGHCSYRKIH
jgi:hypothetical protein